MCAATIQAGGGNLDDFPLSEESIRLERAAHDSETARKIKVIDQCSILNEIYSNGGIPGILYKYISANVGCIFTNEKKCCFDLGKLRLPRPA